MIKYILGLVLYYLPLSVTMSHALFDGSWGAYAMSFIMTFACSIAGNYIMTDVIKQKIKEIDSNETRS